MDILREIDELCELKQKLIENGHHERAQQIDDEIHKLYTLYYGED